MQLSDLFALTVGAAAILSNFGIFALELFAVDVIHAVAMPAIATKMDAIPSRLAAFTLNFRTSGIFRGQCSELCGALHAFMPLEISVF